MATKSTKSTTEKKKTAPAAANVSESKAAPAEKPAEKVFTLAEVQEMIKAAIAESQKDAPARIVYAKDAEQITLCYTGPMAKGTVYSMPGIGSINRQFGYITVSKENFLQKKDYKIDNKLAKRLLIVVSGMTDDERKRYGVMYKPGEILSEKVFEGLLDLPTEQLCEEFKRVCDEHKRIITTAVMSAFNTGDHRATQEKVKALNDLSKTLDERGLLTPVLEKIGENIAN